MSWRASIASILLSCRINKSLLNTLLQQTLLSLLLLDCLTCAKCLLAKLTHLGRCAEARLTV